MASNRSRTMLLGNTSARDMEGHIDISVRLVDDTWMKAKGFWLGSSYSVILASSVSAATSSIGGITFLGENCAKGTQSHHTKQQVSAGRTTGEAEASPFSLGGGLNTTLFTPGGSTRTYIGTRMHMIHG